MEVHIYIGTDSKAPKSCTRKYGYVLECNLRGHHGQRKSSEKRPERITA